MARRYVLSMMAANRVGILAAVTNGLAELGGNLVEASQTVVQEFFTLILAADFPEDRDPQIIQDHLRDVCRPFDMIVTLKDPRYEEFDASAVETSVAGTLVVSGTDQPGILRDVTARLARLNINIAGVHAFARDDGTYLIELKLAASGELDGESILNELIPLGLNIQLR